MALYLKCLLKTLTGFDCPFCGAQRAFVALLHGDISSIWYYNPYLFVISPYLILVTLAIFKVIPPDSRLRKFLYSKWTILTAGLVTISWWIFRNTGYYLDLTTVL